MTEDRYGNIEIDVSDYKDDPVNEFLQDKKRETAPETYDGWIGMLKESESNTGFQEIIHEREATVLDATIEDVEFYLKTLQDSGLADSTINEYMQKISSFYKELRELGVHDANPVAYVLDQEKFDIGEPQRDYHSVAEISEFIKSVPDPRLRTAALMLVKTGIRAGEISNLDICCLHLDDERYKQDYLKKYEIRLSGAIEHRPDTIYIEGDISGGDVVRGEERVDGNKRKRDTVIPVDPELKRSLIDWLSIRPPTQPELAHPLFTSKQPKNGGYNRLRAGSLHNALIQKYARDAGLSEPGNSSEDVDNHYFRHFFTTQMAKNRGDHDGGLDPMLIKYIRGDTLDDDILDIYTHDSWGVNVREEYLENIYNFGVYE